MIALLMVGLLAFAGGATGAQESGTRGDAGSPPVREARLAEGKFVKGAALPTWVRPLSDPPATSRTNPVVIRLAETQLNVAPEAYLVHRAIQVNSTSALGQIGQLPISFAPDFQRLELHQLRVLRDGAVIDRLPTVSVRFLERETGLESGVYVGVVTAMLLVDDVRVGDTLQIVYSVHGGNPVYGQTYTGGASWDQVDPVERRIVRLVSPADRRIAWRMLGDYRPVRIQPQESLEGSVRVLTFAEASLDAVEEEPYTPVDYFSYRWIQFSEYTDWSAVARWAIDLFPPIDAPPPSLQPIVDKLKALPSPEARIVAALQWVQDEIRYFSVSLGESSHRPYPPDQVVARRYGDCKDKTYLLISLLRFVGVEAQPFLVSTHRRQSIARMLPTPDVFDHVVMRIEVADKVYFLDGTRLGQRGALAGMGNHLLGHEGLVVSASSTSLATIGSPDALDLATNELTEEFALTDLRKDAKLTAVRTFHGLSAEVIRLAFTNMTPDQQKKDILGPYERTYPGISLDGDLSVEDDVDRNTLRITARFNVPQAAREFQGDWAVRFFPGNLRGAFNIPQKIERSYPLALTRLPYRARYSLRVVWPENVSMLHDPSAQRVNSDFFTLDVQHSFRGNVSTTRVEFEPRVENISPKQVRLLMEEIQKLDRAIRGVVIAEKAAFKDKGFFAKATTLQENIVARLDRTVAALTRTLDEKRLSGDDLAEALCTRAETRSDRGNRTEALSDANEAVKVAPSLGRVWSCRGNVYFAAGEFARAIQDYSKALSLGEDPFVVHYRRGHARFYRGDFAAAAQDFARARQAKADRRDHDFANLWEIWALRRGGQPLAEATLGEYRQYADQAWPRPALALMAKAITPEQLISEVERKQGDERELMLAEAWFYVGQYHLVEGDIARGKDAFEKALQKKIVVYIEHLAAGFELAQLK